MRTILFEEADPLLTWTGIADAMMAGHKLPAAEIGDLLLRKEENALLSRGAWIEGMGMAMKSMSVFPGNRDHPSVQGGVLLFDGENGSLKAVIDGILITKWKTAGDSILGARLLANPGPKTHLIVGAGTVSASVLDAYSAEFPSIERFLIWNRSRERAEKLVAEKQADASATLEISDNLEEACASADIITTATMSKEPVLRGEWVRPGTHVDLIGAFRPDMREADDNLLQKGELFVDSRETTFGHIGEIEIPLRNGVISREDVLGDFYELCNQKSGRSSPEAITIFKNGGGAHLDLMTSNQVFSAVSGPNL